MKTKMIDGAKHIWIEDLNKYLPERKTVNGIPYLINLEKRCYSPQVTLSNDPEILEMLKEPIGSYGLKWQRWMEEYYPEEIAHLEITTEWITIPRTVDKEADQLYDILNENYHRTYPRPSTFWEIAQWEKMRLLELDSIVMREVVCKKRT